MLIWSDSFKKILESDDLVVIQQFQPGPPILYHLPPYVHLAAAFPLYILENNTPFQCIASHIIRSKELPSCYICGVA